MPVALQLLAGAAACAAFIIFARRLGAERELRLYALGLVTAALVYVGFVARGASLAWLALELAGLALFSLAAFAGLRISHWILAAAWAAHAAWDVLLHGRPGAAFVPGWYPAVCAAFDLPLAAYVAARSARGGSI
jgi:hypothetical protein